MNILALKELQQPSLETIDVWVVCQELTRLHTWMYVSLLVPGRLPMHFSVSVFKHDKKALCAFAHYQASLQQNPPHTP